MSTKISDLTSATSLTGAEELPIVQTGTTKKTTVGDIQKNANYLTTEQRVGTWINGKPLYEKTLEGTVPTTSATGTYVTGNIDITSLSAKVIFAKSIFFSENSDGTGESVAIPYLTNSGTFIKCVITSDRTKLSIINGITTYNGRHIFATLRYTKTTD